MRKPLKVAAIVAGAGVVTVAAYLVFALLTATIWSQDSRTNSPFLKDGSTLTSPSGTYTVEFQSEQIDGRKQVYPVIKDSTGTVVWQDEKRYLLSAHQVGVIWQAEGDVLWLLSRDLGDSRVIQQDGRWAKEWGQDAMPPDIRKLAE